MSTLDMEIIDAAPSPLVNDPSSIESLVARWLTRRSDATRCSYTKDLKYFARWLRAPTPGDAVRLLVAGGHFLVKMVEKQVYQSVDNGTLSSKR